MKVANTVIRNPVIAWRSELSPGKLRRGPPPAPFTVTRSEVRIRLQGTIVHIWYALTPEDRWEG